jgi:hypothetical protein
VPPFRVEYFCPRQSPFWQGGNGRLFYNLPQARAVALMLKPNSPLGRARVVDALGTVLFLV